MGIMEKVLLISPERCIGCGSCELACSIQNEGEFRPAMARISVFRFDEGSNLPMTCLQCEEAACVAACKTGALSRNEAGVVTVDKEKCIGCRMCVMACPFGNASYNRARKTAIKCDQCGGDPQCVAFCPTKAIEYVPADTPNLQRKKAFSAKMAKALEEVK
jgi:Fe-S-cluster-containing hydrogenase component 2